MSARRTKLPPAAGRDDAKLDATELVRAAQNGDKLAFAELYQRYAGMVHGIGLSSLPGDEIADVVQETFFRALRRLSTLRQANAFGAWIAAIARNVVHDVERRRSALSSNDEELLGPSTQEGEMEAETALRAIRSLPKAYQKTIEMRVVQGMTGPEIAGRTGLSAGSVRVNLHRGMKLLRERLAAAIRKKR